MLAAADKIDTLRIAFGLGKRPTGSRDPFGLRRAAIGLDRLATEGGVRIERRLLPDDVRDFVEERLEGLLDVPVEYVRAARASAAPDLGGVARLARALLRGRADATSSRRSTRRTTAPTGSPASAPTPPRRSTATLLEHDTERELAQAVTTLDIDTANVSDSLAARRDGRAASSRGSSTT